MRKFVFREAKLLALRKQQVTIAELSVAAAAGQESAAKQAVNSEMQAIKNLSDEILNSGPNNVTHISQTAMGLRHRLEESRQRLTHATEDLSTAMNDMLQAKLAVESLAELEASRRRSHDEDNHKREQTEIDFLYSRKWLATERGPNV